LRSRTILSPESLTPISILSSMRDKAAGETVDSEEIGEGE
jgi:hypothetical protein